MKELRFLEEKNSDKALESLKNDLNEIQQDNFLMQNQIKNLEKE